jgi:hypothetical protein
MSSRGMRKRQLIYGISMLTKTMFVSYMANHQKYIAYAQTEVINIVHPITGSSRWRVIPNAIFNNVK